MIVNNLNIDIRNKVLSFIGVDLISKLIVAVSIPFYAFFMSESQMGSFGQWFAVFNILIYILGLGLPSYIVVLLTKNENDIKGKLWSAILFIALISMASLIISRFLNWKFTELAVLCSLFSILFQCYLSYFRVTNNLGRYFSSSIIYSLLISFIPLFLVYLTPSWEQRVIGYCIAIAFVPLALLIVNFSNYDKPDFRKENLHFFSLIEFGVPLVIVGVLGWGKSLFDMYLLESYVDIESVGIYFFSIQIISYFLILGATVNKNLLPSFIRLSEKGGMNFVAYIIRIAIVVFISSAIFYLAFAFFVSNFLDGYNNMGEFLLPMSLGAASYVVLQFLFSYFIANKTTWIISLFSFLNIIIHSAISCLVVYIDKPTLIGWSSFFSATACMTLAAFIIYRDPTK